MFVILLKTLVSGFGTGYKRMFVILLIKTLVSGFRYSTFDYFVFSLKQLGLKASLFIIFAPLPYSTRDQLVHIQNKYHIVVSLLRGVI